MKAGNLKCNSHEKEENKNKIVIKLKRINTNDQISSFIAKIHHEIKKSDSPQLKCKFKYFSLIFNYTFFYKSIKI